MAEPLAITLETAAELLSLKDKDTVKRYAREGRISIQTMTLHYTDHADLETMRRALG